MATNTFIQESIDYISNNINAKTTEIPKHLLEYWYVPSNITDYTNEQKVLVPYRIFLHAFDTHNKTLGKEIKLSPLDSINMFEMFQILIRVALGKETELTCNPINLFDFDNYSKLNITVS